MRYGERRPQKSGGWAWVLVIALALLLRFGGGERIETLREDILDVCARFDYAEALETLGRSIAPAGEDAAAFGRVLFGFGAEP